MRHHCLKPSTISQDLKSYDAPTAERSKGWTKNETNQRMTRVAYCQLRSYKCLHVSKLGLGSLVVVLRNFGHSLHLPDDYLSTRTGCSYLSMERHKGIQGRFKPRVPN